MDPSPSVLVRAVSLTLSRHHAELCCETARSVALGLLGLDGNCKNRLRQNKCVLEVSVWTRQGCSLHSPTPG